MSAARNPPPGTRRSRSYLVGGLCVLALLALGAVPRIHASQRARAAAAAGPLKVRVVGPEDAPAQTILTLPGTLEAWTEAGIRARSSGYVDRWYADIGAKVNAGQTLATIVAPELEAALRQARGEQAAAQAGYDIARVTAQRWQAMLAQRATSAQEAEQHNADLRARSAQLAAAKANVVRLAQSVAYTRVAAPFDGIITARAVDVGTLVDAGAASELFHEVQYARLRVVLSVPEGQAAAVRPGLAVQVQVGDQRLEATIARSAARVDLASRMQRVEVDLLNPDGRLLPGQYATVSLTTDVHRPGSIVPIEAVLYRPGGPQIAVVGTDHRVSLRHVHVLQDLGTRLLVEPALASDTLLVANPGDSVAAGDPVDTVPAAGGGGQAGGGA